MYNTLENSVIDWYWLILVLILSKKNFIVNHTNQAVSEKVFQSILNCVQLQKLFPQLPDL